MFCLQKGGGGCCWKQTFRWRQIWTALKKSILLNRVPAPQLDPRQVWAGEDGREADGLDGQVELARVGAQVGRGAGGGQGRKEWFESSDFDLFTDLDLMRILIMDLS